MTTLLQFDAPVLFAFVCTMLFAGLVHGTLGLGFPMVATPILATMTDVRSAILVTLLPTMAVNIASIASNRDSLASARRFLPLVIFTLAGSIVGAGVLAYTDPSPFRLILAGLILLYLWNGIRFSKPWLEQHSLMAMIAFGLCAGLSGGTTNVMVVILIIYFLSLDTTRKIMVPALNSCFLVGKLSQFVVLTIAGLTGPRLLLETLPLALAALGALRFGQRIQTRIEVSTYQALLRKLLLVMSLVLIYQYLLETGTAPGGL